MTVIAMWPIQLSKCELHTEVKVVHAWRLTTSQTDEVSDETYSRPKSKG